VGQLIGFKIIKEYRRLIIDPPATAGGADRFQVRVLTFEAKPCWSNFMHGRKKSFGKQLTVLHLFKHPTIGSLAAQLSHGGPSLEQAD
jgi:hypothetical protein